MSQHESGAELGYVRLSIASAPAPSGPTGTIDRPFGIWGILQGTVDDASRLRYSFLSTGSPPSRPIETRFLNPSSGVVPSAGVVGMSLLGDGTAGVYGENDSAGGVGVWGFSFQGAGVKGESTQSNGVVGQSTDGNGVVGESWHGSGIVGVSVDNTGVVGTSQSNTGVAGTSDDSNGVHGHSKNGFGVAGTTDSGVGVVGRSPDREGVHGESTAGVGVVGTSQSNTGVAGMSNDSNGVHGHSKTFRGVAGTSDEGIGVWGRGGSLAGMFEGDVEISHNLTVNGDIFLPGADCAEHFEVATGADFDAGTVMVIENGGALAPCARSYDKKAAGVISGAGPFRPGIVLDKQAHEAPGRLPIALIGKVFCKVDADISPVGVGDMLTTSATLGHAMKADSPTRSFGAVIGKALGSLSSGRGLVPILVCLQ